MKKLKDKSLKERFEEKYIQLGPDECWPWLSSKKDSVYGNFWNGKRIVIASRFSYELYIGEIPEKLHVCHKCDTPKCVNPNHLFLGTPAENNADAIAKGRIEKQNCPSLTRYRKGCKCLPCKELNKQDYLNKNPKKIKFKNTETQKTYTCMREVAEEFNIQASNVVYAMYKQQIPIIKC